MDYIKTTNAKGLSVWFRRSDAPAFVEAMSGDKSRKADLTMIVQSIVGAK